MQSANPVQTETAPTSRPGIRRVVFGLAGVACLVALAFFLAWVSGRYQGTSGWLSFLGAELLGLLVLGAGWLALRASESHALPRRLAWLLVSAALLRLLVGVIWFTALPAYGYGTPQEKAGYVMADAFKRDRAAWKLSQSNRSLWTAFGSNSSGDQYGGLLYVSALVYRYTGASEHQPLLMVVITACFSALAILFTWAFARRAWGDAKEFQGAAWTAAVCLAVYPEAVLLGSSQMREAFLITLASAAVYGSVRYSQQHTWGSLAWVVGPVLLGLPFSPPLAALILVMVVLIVLASGSAHVEGRLFHQPRFWLLLTLVVLAVTIGIWATWGRFAPEGVTNPIAMIGWWVRKSAEWQAHLSQQASGWIQKIFRSTPGWLHTPLLLLYGVVQPFLPAALLDPSAWVWRLVAIWRSLGWSLLLAFLLYAPLRSLGRGKNAFARSLTLIVWLVILLASLRSGGDQWDNVRYRVVLAGPQIALAAWALVEYRRAGDPWLVRALVSVSLILVWFLPWYAGRLQWIVWPVNDVFMTLGLGAVSAVLFTLWDVSRRAKRKSGHS